MASEIDELLEVIDIEAYLDREGISYKSTHGSRGRQLNVKVCPVCGGKGSKVYLNAETGLGNCFHGDCEAKFNKFTFIKAHLGTNHVPTVVRHLKEVAREMGWRPRRKVTREVITEVDWELPISFPLPIDGQNLVYLQERGIDLDTAVYFHLRYCHDGWYKYVNADGEEKYQNFSRRVIIPVFDLDGTMVTFQGRDITGESDRKYTFPAGLPGTGRFLYNGHNAVGARRVVVGEGVFDVMALKIATDQEPTNRDIVPIGTFGKHLTYGDIKGNDQLGRFIALMKRGLQEVIIMWDGEVKAFEDAIKAGEMLRRLGLKVRIARLPRGKDPNEVPPLTINQAIWLAQELTPQNMIKWALQNPYR